MIYQVGSSMRECEFSGQVGAGVEEMPDSKKGKPELVLSGTSLVPQLERQGDLAAADTVQIKEVEGVERWSEPHYSKSGGKGAEDSREGARANP